MPSQTRPLHVGIIMDGNGRWAQKRGLPRSMGHKEGLSVAKRIVAHASDRDIRFLSLYVFSTENWSRAEEEVRILMNLIKTNLRNQYDFYKERGLKIMHSGDITKLPQSVQNELLLAEKDTAAFTGMQVNLLLNYGGRNEIVRSIKRFLKKGNDFSTLSEESIAQNLDQPQAPELDLMIRTGGEMRLSNFLLWQSAYAELYFSDTYWPDWTNDDLDQALGYFQSRQRRFGGVPT